MIKLILSISSSYTQFAQSVQDLVTNGLTSQSHTIVPSLGGSQSKSAIHLSIAPRFRAHAMWLFVYTSKNKDVTLNFYRVNNYFAAHGQKAATQELVVNSCPNPNHKP